MSLDRSTLIASLGVCTFPFLFPIPSSLWCYGDVLDWQSACQCSATDLLRFLQNTNLKYLSVFVCFLSSHRAKPAGNSNDAGGMDDSDLEKMKQVNFSSAQQHQFLTKSAELE